MQFFTTTFVLGALCVSTASAGYCQFFYDGECKHDANGKIAFSCVDSNAVGTGGQYARCHPSHVDLTWCYIYGVPNNSTSPTSGELLKGPINLLDRPKCLDLGVKGPWYVLSEKPVS